MAHLLSIGLGYSAERLARKLAALGWHVTGTAQSAEGLARIARLGCDAVQFSAPADPASLEAALASASHLLISAAPGSGRSEPACPVLASLAERLPAAPALTWIGYLSTVGVYGDHVGAWVDEDSETRPVSERSLRRLAAERAWLDWGARTGKAVHVFRLAGIYGPGRSAFDGLRAGTARRLDKPGQVFNRIHVEDIAAALMASLASPRAGAIYNLSDDEPAPPQDVVAHAARLAGLPVPPLVAYDEAQASLSPMTRSFYAEVKRVSNALMVAELGVTLAFPSYREGLAAILAEEGGR